MLGRYYVQYFHYTYRRTGTLWEGRYKASLIDSDRYALVCYRYIELNPVRAKMVSHPAMYRWSSFGCNARGIPDELVCPHQLYTALASTHEERLVVYRDLFQQSICLELLDEIRNATNQAWVLGTDDFKSEIEQCINRRLNRLPVGGDRRSKAFKSSV